MIALESVQPELCNIRREEIRHVNNQSAGIFVERLDVEGHSGTLMLGRLGQQGARRVACIAASGIALDTIKRDIPNTPIVGAFCSVVPGVIDVDVFKGLLAKNLSKKFGQEMIDANFAAVERAYEEVTVA